VMPAGTREQALTAPCTILREPLLHLNGLHKNLSQSVFDYPWFLFPALLLHSLPQISIKSTRRVLSVVRLSEDWHYTYSLNE
jgi:hypothetical protein